MDSRAGGGEMIVLMYHATKKGESKLVPECTYPITAKGLRLEGGDESRARRSCALATGFVLREIAPGVTVDEVRQATARGAYRGARRPRDGLQRVKTSR